MPSRPGYGADPDGPHRSGIQPQCHRCHADPERAAAVGVHLDRIEQRIGALANGDTCVNFLDLEGATEKRVRAAYSTADWQRLVRLKERYDPSNLFRFNRTIPGSVTAGPAYVH